MSSMNGSGEEVVLSGEVLDRLVAEVKRFNDRREPLPWTKEPIIYGLIGLGLLAASVLNPLYAVASSFFFIAREIGKRPPRSW
jgi:hypothetical protein